MIVEEQGTGFRTGVRFPSGPLKTEDHQDFSESVDNKKTFFTLQKVVRVQERAAFLLSGIRQKRPVDVF